MINAFRFQTDIGDSQNPAKGFNTVAFGRNPVPQAYPETL